MSPIDVTCFTYLKRNASPREIRAFGDSLLPQEKAIIKEINGQHNNPEKDSTVFTGKVLDNIP
jgi:hypothetical protein